MELEEGVDIKKPIDWYERALIGADRNCAIDKHIVSTTAMALGLEYE